MTIGKRFKTWHLIIIQSISTHHNRQIIRKYNLMVSSRRKNVWNQHRSIQMLMFNEQCLSNIDFTQISNEHLLAGYVRHRCNQDLFFFVFYHSISQPILYIGISLSLSLALRSSPTPPSLLFFNSSEFHIVLHFLFVHGYLQTVSNKSIDNI